MAAKSVVAIPWYLRTDYAQVKILFGDLPETYEVWLDRALGVGERLPGRRDEP